MKSLFNIVSGYFHSLFVSMSRHGLDRDDLISLTKKVIQRSFERLRGRMTTKNRVWQETQVGRKVYRNPIKTLMLLQFEVFDVVAAKLLNSPLSDAPFCLLEWRGCGAWVWRGSGVSQSGAAARVGSGVGREWVGSGSGVSPE